MQSVRPRVSEAKLSQQAISAAGPKNSTQTPVINPRWAELTFGLQPKLQVSAADDPHEIEADRVAEQVMRTRLPPSAAVPATDSQQMLPAKGRASTAPLADIETPLVRRAAPAATQSVDHGVDFESRLGASTGGTPLPAATRAFMEPRFGADFSGVRLHTGSQAAQMNRDIGAQAFAHRQNIYLGGGQTNVESSSGKKLLAHELTHVIQQMGNGHSIGQGVISRAKVHTDKDLFDMMQKFRSKNDQLTEAQQNKIFWAIKKATDSDEVAYKFFDYYSGSFGAGHQILQMTAAEEAKSKDTLATTPSGGDTKLRSDVFTMPDETLGPLLLHEFAHTGQHTNWGGAYDFEEGQAYGVEYVSAERTGDTARTAKIITIISRASLQWGASQGPAVQENFKLTYALMHALADLTKSGSSSLPPLVGKTGDDGRLMAAEFVSDFSDLSKDLTALWDHIRTNPKSFTVPVI